MQVGSESLADGAKVKQRAEPSSSPTLSRLVLRVVCMCVYVKRVAAMFCYYARASISWQTATGVVFSISLISAVHSLLR